MSLVIKRVKSFFDSLITPCSINAWYFKLSLNNPTEQVINIIICICKEVERRPSGPSLTLVWSVPVWAFVSRVILFSFQCSDLFTNFSWATIHHSSELMSYIQIHNLLVSHWTKAILTNNLWLWMFSCQGDISPNW